MKELNEFDRNMLAETLISEMAQALNTFSFVIAHMVHFGISRDTYDAVVKEFVCGPIRIVFEQIKKHSPNILMDYPDAEDFYANTKQALDTVYTGYEENGFFPRDRIMRNVVMNTLAEIKGLSKDDESAEDILNADVLMDKQKIIH